MTDGGTSKNIEQDSITAATRLGVAAFTPTVLCVVAANNVMLSNLLDLPYNPRIAAGFLVAWCILTLVGAGLLSARSESKPIDVLMRLWIAAGVAVLAFDVLSALTRERIDTFVYVVALDEAVGLALLWMILRAPRAVLFRLTAVVALVLAVHGAALHVWTVSSVHARSSDVTKAVAASSQSHADTAGNVYHILLDSFQSEAYYVLSQEHPDLVPNEFTYYPRFYASYPLTRYAIPQLLAGREHRPGESLGAWDREALHNGLWAQLNNAGIRTHLFPHYPKHCSEGAAVCQPTLRLHGDFTSETIDLWFLSILPRSVRLLLNRGAASVNDPDAAFAVEEIGGIAGRGWFSIVGVLRPDARAVDKYATTHAAAFAYDNYQRMLALEETRPGRGQYVFLHAMTPHIPYVLDAECGYVGDQEEPPPPLDGYMAQATCAMRMLKQFTERLQELGRYDDAMIIVHGDHGVADSVAPSFAAAYRDRVPHEWFPHVHQEHQAAPAGPTPGLALGNALWTPEKIAFRSRTLLLVKWPNSSGAPPRPENTFLHDIAPTIAAYFNIELPNADGRPLQRDPIPARQTVFYAAMPSRNDMVPEEGSFRKFVLREEKWEFEAEQAVQK